MLRYHVLNGSWPLHNDKSWSFLVLQIFSQLISSSKSCQNPLKTASRNEKRYKCLVTLFPSSKVMPAWRKYDTLRFLFYYALLHRCRAIFNEKTLMQLFWPQYAVKYNCYNVLLQPFLLVRTIFLNNQFHSLESIAEFWMVYFYIEQHAAETYPWKTYFAMNTQTDFNRQKRHRKAATRTSKLITSALLIFPHREP